jgi:hypothetical protein
VSQYFQYRNVDVTMLLRLKSFNVLVQILSSDSNTDSKGSLV